MNDFIIETRALRKLFDGHPAVDGLDLQVPAGSIFGFLGRNGAGKTTTIRMLLGALHSSGGEVRLSANRSPDQGAAKRSADASDSSPKTRTCTRT
jgi:ABC-2 type transport system ATP-binding protein